MKQFFSILLIACFASINLLTAQVDFTQHSLVSKQTAAWCSNCGQYGWTMFESLLEDQSQMPTGIPITVHYSGTLQNEVSSYFATYIRGFGQPLFFVNKKEMNVTRNNIATKRGEIINEVNNNANTMSIAGLNANARRTESGEIVVDVTYDFASGTTGDYKLGAYLVYNNYAAMQATRGVVPHDRLLWRSFTSDVSGMTINPEAGSTTLTLDTKSLNDNQPIDDMEVLVVIWNNDNTDPAYVNGRMLSIGGIVSNDESLATYIKTWSKGSELYVQDIPSEWIGGQLAVISVNGQIITTTSIHQNQLNLDLGNSSGLNIVRLTKGDKLYSVKVFIQ